MTLKRTLPLLLALLCAGCPKGDGPASESPTATKSPSATSEPGGDPSGSGSTPEAVFARAKSCFEGKDWSGYLDCMTPESQRVNVLSLVQFSKMVVELQTSIKPDASTAAELEAIYEKHGLTAADAETRLSTDSPGIDLPALFQALKAFLEKHSGQGGFSMEVTIGELQDVTIEGEKATGFHVTKGVEGEPDERSAMEFRKVAGRWLWHMEPPGK